MYASKWRVATWEISSQKALKAVFIWGARAVDSSWWCASSISATLLYRSWASEVLVVAADAADCSAPWSEVGRDVDAVVDAVAAAGAGCLGGMASGATLLRDG
jgi:hypothetical protein